MGKPEVDQDLIRQLASLLDETGLTEIEIEDDDRRIRIARQAAQAGTIVAAAPAVAAPMGPGAKPAETAAEAAAADLAAHPGAVTSPMVGTAYRAPEPGAPSFVSIGDQVRAGQTLLIIEAMKTFNEIPAPRDGVVRQIVVDDASPVEFGDVLMIIE